MNGIFGSPVFYVDSNNDIIPGTISKFTFLPDDSSKMYKEFTVNRDKNQIITMDSEKAVEVAVDRLKTICAETTKKAFELHKAQISKRKKL